jgi:molybdopterin molybdotransferase
MTETDTSSTTAPASNGLTSVDNHLADILAAIRPLPPISLGLGEAEGLVLAEDVKATHPLPSFDNSAMDGYAVHAEDVAGASERTPVTLPVVGEVTAGDTGAYALPHGSAIRITTGALLPHGTELVIPVEWTDAASSGTHSSGRHSARVSIRTKAAAGHAIRLAGDDARAGEVLVPYGTRLKPMHIAAIAAAGHGTAMVRPRPRIVVLSTGNELAEPGTPIVPGRIWDSNSYMIAAAAREAGCLAYRQSGIQDNVEQVLATIEDQLIRADLLVTTGGVSMGGEHDVVKAALQQLGTMTFRKVAMQPGMPQGYGTISPAGAAEQSDQIPIITLPGNPVSAYVSFQIFVRPAIGALQGDDQLRLPTVRAELTSPLRSPPGRRSFLRGILDQGKVAPLTGQGSHQVATLGRANALIVVPEWVVQMQAGEVADVFVLP